jgi:hypothetical protein
MDITNFFVNPLGEAVSGYVGIFGAWFYAIIMTVTGVYILIKTESWHTAGAMFILMALLFTALLPAYVIFIWAVAVALSFTFLLIDLLVLK